MQEPSADEIRRHFGLTAAETDIALRLFDGQTLREIAADKGVGISTVRAQLAQVFAKTGTDGQLSLVICLARLVLVDGPSVLPESEGKTASSNGKAHGRGGRRTGRRERAQPV